MKYSRKSLVFMALVGLLVLCTNQLHAEGGEKPFTVTVSDLVEKLRKPVTLDNDRINALQSDGMRKQLPVRFEAVEYTCRMQKTNNEGITRDVGSRTLFLYQMNAKDDSKSYEWRLWSYLPVGAFRLLTDQTGITRLAWADGSALVFADVSRPTGRQARLQEHLDRMGALAPPGAVRVPVHRLLVENGEPTTGVWGVNASYDEFDTRDISKDSNGNWVVTVAPPKSSKLSVTYTFVSDKTARLGWRLVR